ncbi:MAG: Ig-like domain-containing protein, partial [Burkholderiales bacterium]|nr:Ig-like domain-containing protein [Burkholderiales bacterium]
DNTSYLVDTTAPTVVSGLAISSDSTMVANTLNIGDVLKVTATMSEATVVTGTPKLALNIGGSTVYASYASGTGTTALVFNYTIQAGQTDANGISIANNSLALNGGTLSDAAGNAATLTHAALTDNASFLVDAIAPTVSSLAISSATGVVNNTLNAGDVLSVTVNLGEAVSVTGTPQLALNIGGSTVYASYASGTGTTALVFNYTIQAGQTDAGGISIDASSLGLNSGANLATIKDAAGNTATLTHLAVSDNASYKVDTSAPTLSSSTPAGNAIDVGASANLVLTFNESVAAGSGNLLISNGSDTRTIAIGDAQVTISGASVTINPSADLTSGSSYNVQMASGVLTDAAGNAYAGIANATTLNFATITQGSGVNLSAIAAGTGGFVINGQGASDQSGVSVASAGDVNGDGLADLIVGANWSDPTGAVDGGRSYVVFGQTGSGAIDLSAVAAGSGGFVINGQGASDQSGASVASAGDVNGDGLADLIVGAYNSDPAAGSNAGRSYVVFGQTGSGAIDLSAVAAGSGGFVING